MLASLANISEYIPNLLGHPVGIRSRFFPWGKHQLCMFFFFTLPKKLWKRKGGTLVIYYESSLCSMSHKISSNLVNRFSHQEVFLLRTRKVEHFCCPVYGWMMQCGAWQTSVYEEDGELFCLQVILERCRTWYYSINIVFSGMKYQ